MERQFLYPVYLFKVNLIDVSFFQWMNLLNRLLSNQDISPYLAVGWEIFPKYVETK